MSVFDLLAAKHYAQGVRLRELRDAAFQKHPILKEFEIDPYAILQAIALYHRDVPASCTRGYILDLAADTINDNWGPVVQALVDVLGILRKECGVICGRVLPSMPMLLPMANLWARARALDPKRIGDVREKMKQWFWCAVFGNAYSKSANSQAVQDAKELWSWVNGGGEPEVVRTARMLKDALRTTTQRQSIRYYGVMCLVIKNGALDFYSGAPIDSDMVLAGKVEDHHIFPAGYIRKVYPDPKPSHDEVNSVLNRTFIDELTNGIISDKAPSQYWSELKQERSATDDNLNAVLGKHAIPTTGESHPARNKFDSFISGREDLVLDLIQSVTCVPKERWQAVE